MTDIWYYTNGGQQIGPVPFAKLTAELPALPKWKQEYVWRPGLEGWVSATTIPELATDPPPLPPKLAAPEAKSSPAKQNKTSPLKILFWVIATPFLAFVAFTILFAISEGLSDDQYYATSVGLSLSECRTVSMTLGATRGEAEVLCNKRVPKKR
jgi:hypothetical protein